ncbi:MAG: hypothetical protein C0490_04165, partial [Marivirga sp.]|nr:hypothetical protein [Marivirga sp.]
FEVDLKLHEKMLNNFLNAVSEGNVEDLIDLLKEDIVLFADGGGKSFDVNRQRLSATLKPIYGRENVIRLLLKVVPKLEYIPDFNREITLINGLPSLVSYSDISPMSIVSFERDGDHIKNIYIQTNPDKLVRFKKLK